MTVARKKRTKKKLPAPTPTTTGCLRRVRAGYLDAVGVLADHLEESDHPLAGRVRALWNSRLKRARHFAARNFSRSKRWTRWSCIAYELIFLRRDILIVFGRKVERFPDLRTTKRQEIYGKNEGLIPLADLTPHATEEIDNVEVE